VGTVVGAIDDFWLAHPELDRDGPCEILGEHHYTS
jgi:hypothetical protein